MKIETKCLHEGYTPANGEPLTLPIYQSTTYKYESTAQVAKLFDLTDDGHMYSRISNPTVAAVEEKIAALTREVREHNNFARRMPVVEEQIRVINHMLEGRGQPR